MAYAAAAAAREAREAGKGLRGNTPVSMATAWHLARSLPGGRAARHGGRATSAPPLCRRRPRPLVVGEVQGQRGALAGVLADSGVVDGQGPGRRDALAIAGGEDLIDRHRRHGEIGVTTADRGAAGRMSAVHRDAGQGDRADPLGARGGVVDRERDRGRGARVQVRRIVAWNRHGRARADRGGPGARARGARPTEPVN